MEDDEDLEFLRLAALKSLNNKKDVATNAVQTKQIPTNITNSTTIKPNKIVHGNHETYDTLAHGFFEPKKTDIGVDFYTRAGTVQHNDYPPIDNYVGGRLEQLDINEPYLPQPINPRLTSSVMADYRPPTEYVPYVPSSSVLPVSNVQLSPRSAAFVSENTDILLRRKGGRSPSPWSMSPKPASHHSWNYRRSGSRSPAHQYASRSPRRSPRRSPMKRTLSRSPERHVRRYSPNQPKRTKSRSPNRTTFLNRHRSRSPLHPSNRRLSPNRNGPKNLWRCPSPLHQAPSLRPNGNHPRKSQSPPCDLYAKTWRARSPGGTGAPCKPDIRKRSNSRSPGRKYGRNGPPIKKRRTPPASMLPTTARRPFKNDGGHAPNNDNRPANADYSRNNRRRRSQSPRHRNRRSRSRSRNQNHKPDNVPSNQSQLPQTQEIKTNEEHSTMTKTETKREVHSAPQTKPVYEANELPEKQLAKAKSEQEIEEDLLASSDDAVSINDGIDLFASEESESENEGRFKSRSSKTERTTTTATLSFTKLGTVNATALVVRDLNEVRSDKASSTQTSRKDRDSRRDRDRDRNGNNNYSGRRNDRFGASRKSGSRDRDRGRGKRDDSRSRTWKSSKHDSRKDELDRDSDKHKKGSPKQNDEAVKKDVNEKRKSNLEEGIFVSYTILQFILYLFSYFFIFIGCINCL